MNMMMLMMMVTNMNFEASLQSGDQTDGVHTKDDHEDAENDDEDDDDCPGAEASLWHNVQCLFRQMAFPPIYIAFSS